jgi:thiol-disulfide isomerase/thioredoxin
VQRNWLVIGVLAVVLAVMLGAAVWRSRSAGVVGSSTQMTGSVEGRPAPDFALTDIYTGKIVRLADFRGKAVLLNFWATWCPPCKVEIPWFIELQNQYGPQGLAVIGVAMDDAGRDKIEKFGNEMRINYIVLQGTETVANAYGGVESLPTTFYIDREGRIVSRVLGLRSHSDVEANVKRALSPGQQRAGAAREHLWEMTGSR